MGKRGGSGGGGRGKGGGPGDIPMDKPSAVDAAAENNTTPEAAADELGLTGSDKDSFVDGANATGKKLDGADGPEAAVEKFKAAVIAYERKYGRGAAHAYSRGGYWSLLRFIKTTMAVTASATQVAGAPAMAAVNTALVAAYWLERAKR